MRDGILIASPVRVVALVGLRRDSLVKLHTLGVTLKESSDKMTQLYKFIRSSEYASYTLEAMRVHDELADLDRGERKDQESVWKRREVLTVRLRSVLNDVDNHITVSCNGTMKKARPLEADKHYVKGALVDDFSAVGHPISSPPTI